MCISEAFDAMIIWSSTFRAISIDDFRDAIEGRSGGSGGGAKSGSEDLEISKKNWKERFGGGGGSGGGGGGGKNDEMSVQSMIQMIKMMGGSGGAKK